MIRNLILVFGLVVVAMLGLTAYHLASLKRMTEQPVPISHWEDTTGRATVQDVMKVQSFEPVRKRRSSFGYTESIHWFRFRLVADSLPAELSFEIRNHTIDRLELFELKQGVVTSLGRTGSRFPFASRPSPTKTFVYLLTVDADSQRTGPTERGPTERGPTDYYLMLDKRYENLTTELILWRTSDFEDKEQREYFLWGIFAGVVGLVVLLAFLFYATSRDPLGRDPVYVWYGLYILGLAFRQFADTGLGFQYLWPRLPGINHPDSVIMAIWLYVPAMLQFQQHFLQLRTVAKRLFWVQQGLKWAFWAAFVCLVIAQLTGLTDTYSGSYRLMARTHTILANTCFLVFFWSIAVGLRAPDTMKRLYAVGFGIQIFGQLFVVAQNVMQYQPDGIFFVDAYIILMVNFFIDLVIFAYLLAYRYRNSTDEQRRLTISLAQTQQQTNNAIIDVLESERQQVGNLLVSDVGGRLSHTRALLLGQAPSPLLTGALDLIGKTEAGLDQILRDSLPADLTRKGLAKALSELVQQRDQSESVRLLFSYDGDQPDQRDLSAMQTRQLYRITNELLNNMIKHAQATEGWVSLCQTPTGWQLTVSDNGQGFDVDRAKAKGGIGLKNLYARAQTLDATVQVESGQSGTTVRLVLG